MAKPTRLLLLLLSVLSLLACTGCLPSMILSERALLQTVGIDKTDNGYLLTLEIFFPASDSEQGVTAENAVTLSAEGATVTDALQQAALQLGKQLFLGQIRVLVLGGSLVEEGVYEFLCNLSKNADLRQNLQLCVCEGEAAQVITAQVPKYTLPSEALESLLENAGRNSLSQPVALFEYLRAANSPYQTAVLPLIEVTESEEEEENRLGSLRLNGLAVLQNGRLADRLSPTECRAFRLLTNQLTQAVLNVETPLHEIASLRIYDAKTTVTFSETSGFSISAKVKAALPEFRLRQAAEQAEPAEPLLAEAAARCLEAECSQLLQHMLVERRMDVLGLWRKIGRASPALWQQLSVQWMDRLPDYLPTVTVQASLERGEVN